MANLDGQIFFALLTAMLLAWLVSLVVAHRYTAKLLQCMQSGLAPDENAAASASADFASAPAVPCAVDLGPGIRFARFRLWLAIVLLSLAFAGVIAAIVQAAYIQAEFGWRRWSTLVLVYAWPLVPSIGLLERWSRLKISVWSVFYLSLVAAVVMANSTAEQPFLGVVYWLLSEQAPLLIYVFVFTGPTLRSSGPYLIPLLFLLCLSSLAGLQVLAGGLEQGLQGWAADLPLLLGAEGVFALFVLAPWLLAYPIVRGSARWLAGAYRRQAFSEPWYLIGGLWLIVLLFQAMRLSHSVGASSYWILAAFGLMPIAVTALRRSLAPTGPVPGLLVLRVFRADRDIEHLFDQVIERWRYGGHTLLIAGKDLALRNLEPDELFAFMAGRLRERFIDDEASLRAALQALASNADADGRFRVNEFFCFDHTWKKVLMALLGRADRVLMDLRGFSAQRLGCCHELSVLAGAKHLRCWVIVFDRTTDRQTAERLVAGSRIRPVWLDSRQADAGRLALQALLEANDG
ncbi:hypothetical protein [Methylomonas rhizoryzae]|uniref:hypothetical protein n=1 Tax=Methylomonas rhizoryzae TaxID=2608981 RepID=UPI001231E72A|nr:hypothetical protein [Methylomonas rhizoryzae]